MGNVGLSYFGDFDVFCASDPSPCSLTIEGTITFDENLNCAAEGTEINLQQWMVQASSAIDTFYGITDADGHYEIYTSAGDYTVALIPTGPYWDEICTNPAMITVNPDLDLQTVDFFPSVIIECPYLAVDISTPFLRRCFANTYVVNYCNTGTALAEEAIITIELDDFINIDSTSIAISSQVDNTLTFELGDVAINECASFFIYTNVSCDVELGQLLCATAHITPDSICNPPPEWSGATVSVKGVCVGDEVHFTIKNIGEGDMLQERNYIVIEDGIIMLQGPPFQLNADGEFEVALPANGSTYVCRAMQVDNHPVAGSPTAAIEACGVNDNGNFSLGYAGQFPEYDDANFISIDCHEVVGSFDPNDKTGFPLGYSEEHFIEKEQDIEYHIRFQNTGSDTAFTVLLEDEISVNLDITTFRQGASSHPYTVKVVNSHTLQFVFDNILLVDSTTNEMASHGFVKFKISQNEGLELGTTIENQAGIYFDFNESVLTNKTLHTIGEHFVETTAINELFVSGLKVSLAPNPVRGEATIRLSGISFQEAEFSLFNSFGTLLRQKTINGNEMLFKKGNLATGVYFFEIQVDNQIGFIGKLVIH